MNSDGEDLSDTDDSGDGFMVGGKYEEDEAEVEEVEGNKVAQAMHVESALELVCVDSGCNRVILVSADGVAYYRRATKSFLRTAQVEGD